MIRWELRSHEEKCLLSPSFCSLLLWHAARARQRGRLGLLSFEESFLILPFVLDRQVRDKLPRTLRTSLAVWLSDHPLEKGRIVARAKLLVPFTKESLVFSGQHSFMRFEEGMIVAADTRANAIRDTLKRTSDEVRACVKKAEFVARWFSQTGSPGTVLAMLGVRP